MKNRRLSVLAVLTLLLASVMVVVAPTSAYAHTSATVWNQTFSCSQGTVRASTCVVERSAFCPPVQDLIGGWWYHYQATNLDVCYYSRYEDGSGKIDVADPEMWVRYANGNTDFERYEDDSCNDAAWNWEHDEYYYYGDQVYHNGTTWRMKYTGGYSYWNEPGHPSWDYVWQSLGCF